MHRAELVISLGEQNPARCARLAEQLHDAERLPRPPELQAHQDHQTETEQQEAEGGEAILDADPLVVRGEDIAANPRLMMPAVRALLIVHDTKRLAERPVRFISVHPLRTYPDLSSQSHVLALSFRF